MGESGSHRGWPENFQDPSLVSADARPHGITFQAITDVLESLGAEKYVYFNKDLGKTKYVTELEERAKDAGRADSGATSETVVTRLDPATRISEGDKAQLRPGWPTRGAVDRVRKITVT